MEWYLILGASIICLDPVCADNGYAQHENSRDAGACQRSPAGIRQLLLAGVDVFRLNASHSTQAEHAAASRPSARMPRSWAAPPASCSTCRAPRSGSARFAGGGCTLETGGAVHHHAGAGTGRLPARLHHLPEPAPPMCKRGDRVLLADGAIELRVVDIRGLEVRIGGRSPAGRSATTRASICRASR